MKTRHVVAILGALVAVAPPAAAQGYGGSSAYPGTSNTYSPRRENERRWQEAERERERMIRERERAQREYYKDMNRSAFDGPRRRY